MPRARTLCQYLHKSSKEQGSRKSDVITSMVMQVNFLKHLIFPHISSCFLKNLIFPNLLRQYGQFLDHDITLTPEMEQNCCLKTLKSRPECAPIFIEKRMQTGDSVFNFPESRNQSCIPFTRSTQACNVGEGEYVSKSPFDRLG